MNELNLPVERLYATLLKYIDGGEAAKLEKYHMEYKEEFEEFLEERKRYWVDKEMETFRRTIAEIKLELNDIWQKVEKMYEEYKLLKLYKDYETMILKYQEWAPAWFDFKDKYLNRDYVMNKLNKISDKVLNPIMNKTELCFIWLSEPAMFSWNNLMNQKWRIWKACSTYCKLHGYYWRLHESKYIKKWPLCNMI